MSESNYPTIPAVIMPSSSGPRATRIIDLMYQRREVELMGDVDAAMADSVCLQLRHLALEDPNEPITLVVNSYGGSVIDGMAIFDVMNAIPCPVNTLCLGKAASMGALLFINGAKRTMLAHSKILIHDPLIPRTGGSALELKAVSDDLMRTRELIGTVIAEHTGKPLEEVFELTAKETWLTAQEAVEWHLADEVATEL